MTGRGDVHGLVERLLRAPGEAQRALRATLTRLSEASASERATWFDAALGCMSHPHPRVGAQLALLCGAMIEDDQPPERLAAAVKDPLKIVATGARRFYELARRASSNETEGDDDDVTEIGRRRFTPAELTRLTAQDELGANAYFSLETWYLPVVAAWTRRPRYLQQAQLDAALIEDFRALEWSGGAYWISILLEASFETPLIVIVPELGEVYRAELDGVCDMGQLTVLLSRPFADVLGRIGAPEVASDALFEVMSGEGSQRIDGAYGSAFHVYPWQAVNPATGLPENDRFQWSAPGGTGTGSLPADFQPSAIAPLNGTRVVAVVGPHAENTAHWVRVIGGARSFEALQARISAPEKLEGASAKYWLDSVRRANSS